MLCPYGVGDSGSTGREHADARRLDSMVNGFPLTFCYLVPGHLNLYVFRNYKCSEFLPMTQKECRVGVALARL